MKKRGILFFVLLQLSALVAFPADVVWNNGGGNNLWSNDANWVGGLKPGGSDVAVFNSTSTANCSIDMAVSISGIRIEATYSGTVTQQNGNTIILSSSYSQAAGTFTGGNSNITTYSFDLSGGTFTSTSATLDVNGIGSVFGVGATATFTHNNGKLKFSTMMNFSGITLTLGANLTLYTLEINAGDYLLINGGTIIITNLLDLYNGGIADGTASPEIEVRGAIAQVGGTFTGQGVVEVKNGPVRTISTYPYSYRLKVNDANVTMNISGASLYFLEINAGTVNASGAIYLTYGFSQTGGTFTFSNEFNVYSSATQLSLTGGTMTGGAGDIKTEVAFTVNGGSLTMGSGNFAYIWGFPADTVNPKNLMLYSGTINASACPFMFVDNLYLEGGTFTAPQQLRVTGTVFKKTASNTFNHNNGLVHFKGSTASNNNWKFYNGITFYNVKFEHTNNAYGVTLDSTTTMTVANNFTFTNGSHTIKRNVDVNGNIIIASTNDAISINNGVKVYLAGNLTDNCTANKITSSGILVLDGNALQTLTSSVTIAASTLGTELGGLTVNNSSAAGVTMSGDFYASDTLTLTDGIIHTNSYNFGLSDGVVSTLGSYDSYIDGTIEGRLIQSSATTPETILFPLGKDNDYRPFKLRLDHSSNTRHYSYTATLANANAEALGYTKPSTISNVSRIHYLNISRSYITSPGVTDTSGFLDSAFIGMYYYTGYGSDDQVTDATNLGIAKTSGGNSSLWKDISTASGGTANGSGYIYSAKFYSFSKFSVANRSGGTNPLPINLLNFNAVKSNKNVNLSWQTASEKNNDYFTVERSLDGVNYTIVTKVNGAGNSTTMLNYGTVDYQPETLNLKPETSLYYRLKQTDYDGSYTYSDVKSVVFGAQEAVNFDVFPNPSANNENISVQFNANAEGTVLMVLTDINGKEIYSKEKVIEEGSNQLLIENNNTLPPGIYFITASSNQSICRKKVMVR